MSISDKTAMTAAALMIRCFRLDIVADEEGFNL
jgi:hypothetical protein